MIGLKQLAPQSSALHSRKQRNRSFYFVLSLLSYCLQPKKFTESVGIVLCQSIQVYDFCFASVRRHHPPFRHCDAIEVFLYILRPPFPETDAADVISTNPLRRSFSYVYDFPIQINVKRRNSFMRQPLDRFELNLMHSRETSEF